MGCDFPITAYRSAVLGPNGKYPLVFNSKNSLSGSAIKIPCNNCMGCKLERSRQWAIRIMHESKFHDQNCFLTLTYSDQTVPIDYSLKLRHLQLFIKRLRKSLPQKIRFYACGEYGDQLGRPHYHSIIFNHDWSDKTLFKIINGKKHYTSDLLTNLWQLGHCTTADVTFQSAAYCARYVTKKLKTADDVGQDRYYRVSPVDGRYHSVKPEFSVMSRRPGIGHAYTEQYKSDYYPSGYIVHNGVRQAPPRYYISKLTEEEQQKLKMKNVVRSMKTDRDERRSVERKHARAAARDVRIKQLKRNFEG